MLPTIIGGSLWLSVAFGMGTVSVDVGGSVVFEAETTEWLNGHTGIALPHVALVDPDAPNDVLSEELLHHTQWDALGPGFALAYALGQGREFEPYLADGRVWRPPIRERFNCPILRVDHGVKFFPCWIPYG